MLYKKNGSKTLTKELFENPTCEYRAAPFWSWNAKLDKAQLERQIGYMKQMGFGGFHMHPRTGLDTEYLSDEFMEMIKACCDKAEAEQMLAWLYDEDRWSSGPAGGKVTRHKKFRRKRLTLFTEDKGWNTPKDTAIDQGVPYLLACYDVVIDKDGYLAGYSRIGYGDSANGTKWYAYVVNEAESSWFNNQTYVDAMDAEAMQEFIKVTYERYNEVISDRFDKSVPAIFTDEPNANHEYSCTIPSPEYTGRISYGWSRFFEEKYQKTYGSDILDVLPELFWIKKDRSDSVVKYRYFDFVAKMFSENFSKQLGDWCNKHGIAFTGHLLREPQLTSQSVTCGETMRNYGKFGIPGIDILCDQIELTTAKQAQSAVHQYGKEGMLSELYGVTNWDFDFRGHKFQGDWQAALGVTVRVPHLAWLSMAGEAKRDYPASISYQSPWYKEYPIIEDHFARVNTALTRGTPVVSVGVLHPVESYWISAGPNSQMSTQVASLEENFKNITTWLLENHLDFDYICESQLPELSDKNNPRAVGKMSYEAIVVPGCLTLRTTTIEYLDKFSKAGGRVIFTGSCPEFVDGVVSNKCHALYQNSVVVSNDCASISEALEDFRTVGLRLDSGAPAVNLLYNYRADSDGNWLFIAHSKHPVFDGHSYGVSQSDVTNPHKVTITVTGEFTPVEYDTLTGKILPISYYIENGRTVIDRVIYAYDSLLLKLTAPTEKSLTVNTKEYEELARYDIKHALGYKLSEPNVLLLDLAEYAFDDGEYMEKEDVLRIDNKFRDLLGYPHRSGKLAQPYTMPREPETHTLHLRYTFESEIEASGVQLALEDAEKVTVHFNGDIIPSVVTGYFTDESIKTVNLPDIKKGINTLVLDLPFGKRTNVEWCYILGDFGVRVCGCESIVTSRQQKLGFGDVTPQGLPFYGANITYVTELDMPQDGAVKVHASNYRGSLIGVSLDGVRVGSIVLPPYDCVIENVAKGKHTLELTVYGNRHNSFGALHIVNEAERWFGPGVWRTSGDNWSYEYKLKRFGILKSPIITLMK